MMLVLAMVCTTATTFAADDTMSLNVAKGSTEMGTLRGRVTDSSDQFLSGAAVYVKELNRGVACDANGFYTFQAVQSGEYTVEVSYVGYNVASESVKITPNKTTLLDIKMDESTTIENVLVTSVTKGQARALSSQKSALNMMDVISSDQSSKYPDSNIGDALKRISGVNVQYDQGEARFGQVRGTPADMSSVTINGDRLPSAEGGTRNVQLDLIPADMIQTIEVNKVITPDMDADAIGGSINLVTKNSPSRQVISANVGTGYDVVGQKPNLNLGLTYGDVSDNEKFGYIVSASYQNSFMGSDNTEFAWAEVDGKDLVDEYQIRQYYVQRERQSYSASFNYNINANHKLDFKGIYNRRNDWENRYRTKVKDLTKNMDEGDDYGMNSKVAIETKGGSADSNYSRLERQQTMNFAFGGEHMLNKLMVDWSASWAKASEDRPEERYVAYEYKSKNSGGVTMDYSDKRQPFAMFADGSNIALTEDYELADLYESNQEVSERDMKYKVNFKLPISEGHNNSSLSFGAKAAMKKKESEVIAYDYLDAADVAGNDVATAAYATIKSQDRDGFMPGEKYNYGRTFVDREWLGDQDFSNNTLYDQATALDNQITEESAGNYNATEDIYSAFVRFDQKLGEDVDLMAGVRMENTNVTYQGTIWDEDADTLSKTDKESSSYTNVLPSVMVKWSANNDLKLRASFTNTLARPSYEQLVPGVEINEDNEATVGNPDLNAALGYNADLSADYYFPGIGLIRAGVFYKRINDFIVDQRLEDVEYGGTTFDLFTQPINAGNADMIGAELVYQRDLSFISPSLNFMGISGTYTYTHSSVSDFNVEGRENETGLKLPGSPEHTANASIYAEKFGFTVRLSYNYASDFIDELGKEAYDDVYYDKVGYLDLNLNYAFKKNFSIYADATNLLNQPLRYYQGESDRTYQVEYYGPRFNAGVKFTF